MMTTRTWLRKEYLFSFQEVITELGNCIEDVKPFRYTDLLNIILNDKWEDYFGEAIEGLTFAPYNSQSENYNINSNVSKMFDLLYNRLFNHGLLKLDHDTILATDKPKVWVAMANIFAQIEKTYTKYDKLLTLYASQSATLMKQIESSSVNVGEIGTLQKRNDTPQNVGDYSGDTYATEVNKSDTDTTNTITNKTDKDSPIIRLNEIQTLYRNLLKDWTDEMERCFYEEEVGY